MTPSAPLGDTSSLNDAESKKFQLKQSRPDKKDKPFRDLMLKGLLFKKNLGGKT